MGKKKTTQEILAALRAEAKAKQQGGGAAPEPPTDGDTGPDDAAATPAAEASAASEASAEPSAPAPKPASGGGKPKSTADILAAARAQAGNKPAAAGGSNGDGPQAPKAVPKPGGAPKSTKDILAAARAQSAGGGGGKAAPATGGGTATATKPAKAKPAVAPAGEKPSLEEMLKAVRQGAPIEKTAPKPAAAAGPKTPRKPVPAKAAAAKAETGTRRNFLLAALVSPFALAWIFFSGIMAAWGLALARFMMPNVLVEPPSRFNVGSPGKYAPGTVSEEYKPAFGVWLVNATVGGQQMIYALSSVCTHLGCTPGWLEGEQKFKCPCHGSGFYITGVNFEGPAPRPLERHAIHLLPDGTLEVDKSQKFQQEMGQWDDPASFVPIA